MDKYHWNLADYVIRSSVYARRTLLAGFTTVRNLGDTANESAALRNAINAGVVPGPRIYTAGKAIGSTGGHADPTDGLSQELTKDVGAVDGIGTTTTITAGRGGLNADQARVMADAIAALKQAGAVIVDPADVPSLAAKDPKENFAAWDFCSGADQARGKDEGCSVNFKYGMKRDFNLWLKSLGASAPVKTLTELRQWNTAHTKSGAIKFGQSRLDISDEMDLERDRARNDADHRKDWLLSRDRGIDGALKANNLDAILTPGGAGAGLAARSGYPIIVVPFGLIPNAPANAPFPAGFDAKAAPFGVGFTGTACSEPRLIALAYAFEQATKKRVPPPSTP